MCTPAFMALASKEPGLWGELAVPGDEWGDEIVNRERIVRLSNFCCVYGLCVRLVLMLCS